MLFVKTNEYYLNNVVDLTVTLRSPVNGVLKL
jgi:hypothetical protein